MNQSIFKLILISFFLLIETFLYAQNTLDKIGLTSSTLPKLAYSLRQLSSSYSGPLVRVHTGTAYYDVYPDASSGLISLDSKISLSVANSSSASAATSNSLSSIVTSGVTNLNVVIWYDQSGNAIDVKTSSVNAPKLMEGGNFKMLNGKPTIYFAGVSANSDFLRSSTTMNFATFSSATYSIVVQNVASTYSISGIVNTGSGGAWGFAYSTVSPYGYYVDGSGCMNATTGELSTSPKFFTAITNQNVSSYIYENGYLKASKTTSNCNFTPTTSYVTIGQRDGGTRKFDGNMSEIILFPKSISTSEQNTIETSQRDTYFAPSVSISSTASNNTICAGTSVTFTATTFNATNPTFQWKKNGAIIPGETATTYTTTNLANNDVITVEMYHDAANLTSNLVSDASLLLKLDATDPTSYSGTGTTWSDLSGLNNHATLNSHQSFDASGSIQFDGTNNPVVMPLVTNAISNVTMQCWVYLDANTVGPFMKNGISGGYSFGTGPGGNSFGLGNKATMLLNAVAWQPLAITMGYGWKLVTMTISGTTESLYVNDVLIGTRTGTPSAPATGTYLGSTVNDNSGSNFFNSKMAGAFMYSKALTMSEIAQNYYSGRYKLSPATAVSNSINLRVNAAASASLSSANGTDSQSICINSALTSIVYTTSNVSAATFSGLPSGVTGTFANNTVTVSGTPSVSGLFSYSVNLTSACGGVVSLTGSINVSAINTISLLSSVGSTNQTLCLSSAISPIQYVRTGATGASISGLPTGISAVWSNDTLSISGTPNQSGNFNYTIGLTGGCGNVSVTGSIVVNATQSGSLTSGIGTNSQIVCANSSITPITYSTSGATGATFSGLPTGVSGTWNANVISISGTPTLTGSFPYTITLVGGCGNTIITGSIQVSLNTIQINSAYGTDSQSKCINSAITPITYSTTGATGATFSGLPAGVSGTWVADVVTISGTPTAAGTFNYTVTLTGGCGNVSASGSLNILSSSISITSSSATNLICYGSPVTFSTTVTNPGVNGTYQWYKNGLALVGETASSLTTSSLVHNDAIYVSYSSSCTLGGNIIANGLIQHLDAANSASYSGTGTTWYDISGNANHGALNSAVFTNDNGVKYFTLANTYITAPLPKTTSMTFSAWAKSSNPSSSMLFNAGLPGSGPDLFFFNGRIFWNIWDAENNPFVGASLAMINADFHQYTVVVDAVANNAKLYLDGALIGTSTYKSPTLSSPTELYIGGAGPGDGWKWPGGFRNFLSYNRALSPAEVLANYNSTLVGGGAVNSNTISTTVSKITLTSPAGTDAQIKCISTAITNIVYSATGATGATVSGLPSGVNWAWSNGSITISGSPTVSGTFNYSIELTGGCDGQVRQTGSIVVNPNNTIALSSASGTNNQSLCINTAMTDITYATTSATGASFSGLPTGISGSWTNHVITISGTPTVSGTFNYTITLTGGCGVVTAMGTLVINPNNTISLSSAAGTNAQSVCINTVMTNISYNTTGATNASVTGLPSGVTGSFSNNVVTISGTPTAAGNYTYTVSLSGGCGTTSLSGTILVKAINTITLSSAVNTDAQSICKDANLMAINYGTAGATGASFSGLPAGVSGAFAANMVSISGAPTAIGVFPYTVNVTGGCGVVSASGTITVLNLPTINVAVTGNSCAEKSVMTASSGFLSYTWYKDNVVVNGVTANVYSPTARGNFKVLVSDGSCSNTSSTVAIYECALTTEGNIVPTTSTLLVNSSGGMNNGTGLTDEGKSLNITATTTIDIIETAASGATLVLNLDARNVNSLARTATPGTWYDLSGNQNDATIYGTVAYGAGNGGALNFPGGNANYVQAKSGVYFTGGSFTIQSWVYPMQLYNWNRIIDFGNGAGSNNILLSNTYGMSGNPGLYVQGAQFQSTRNLSLNAWHHVCATFDTNTRIATIYVDGQAAGSAVVPRPVNVVRNYCYIGRSNWGFGDPNFAGGMGALQIYNGFLTAAEILSNYNSTKGLYGL